YLPAASFTQAHQRPAAVHQQRGRTIAGASPDAFTLDFRVQGKGRVAWLGQAKSNRIAEILAGKTQAQTHRVLPWTALYRHVALEHAPGNLLRPCPETRFQPAFAGQRVDHATLG